MQTGKSTEEALQAMKRNVVVLPLLDVEEGIKAARLLFPRVYFDQDKCPELLESLKRYQRSINEKTREPGAPLHDQYSHDADMFRYVGMAVDQMSNDDWSGALKYPKLNNG
jgi:phage terminase large subunit